MPRPKLQVDKNELSLAIQTAESVNPFNTRQELAEAVANCEWGQNIGITPSVVLLRINEFGLESIVKTPKGKRGRQAGQKLSQEHKDALQSGRGKKKVDGAWINELKRVTPLAYLPVIEKIEKGSLKAQTKLMCLQCTNYNKQEIKHCTIKSCALFPSRPYK